MSNCGFWYSGPEVLYLSLPAWGTEQILDLKLFCCCIWLSACVTVRFNDTHLLQRRVSSTPKQAVLENLPFSVHFVVSSLHEAATTLHSRGGVGSAKQSALYHSWTVWLWFHHTAEYFPSCTRSSTCLVFNIQSHCRHVSCLFHDCLSSSTDLWNAALIFASLNRSSSSLTRVFLVFSVGSDE